MNLAELRNSLREGAALSYSRSGGPGGQHVNKVNTKVTLRVRLGDLGGLSETELNRLRETLAARITGEDEIVIAASEERSRRTNQERAFARAEALITASARLPKHRRSTKPSRTAEEQRLQSKRLRGLKKSSRRCSFSPD
ncbi:MAG: aminoacyl-tRNA hydrolase [Treponema sp.]|jgi:ribosome-associated protein|nr:aminoacyl-tRNA hydrolase [Treponema sp.]